MNPYITFKFKKVLLKCSLKLKCKKEYKNSCKDAEIALYESVRNDLLM